MFIIIIDKVFHACQNIETFCVKTNKTQQRSISCNNKNINLFSAVYYEEIWNDMFFDMGKSLNFLKHLGRRQLFRKQNSQGPNLYE
jgi:hypothetical protein